MTRAMGIDLAHGRTGLVLLPAQWAADGRLDWRVVGHLLITGSDVAKSHPVDRRAEIVGRVLAAADAWDADVLAVEESFSARNSAAAVLAKLHGELERRCHADGRELVRVTRAAAYRLAIGRGNAPKEALQAMLQSAGAPFAQADICDAWAIANYALSERGFRCVGVAA